MRFTAAVVSLTLLMAGCFPHNAKYRAYAKWAEGGSLVAGIALAGLSGTTADCPMMVGVEGDQTSCRNTANALQGTAVVLILAGRRGVGASVSTAADEDGVPKPGGVQKPATTASAAKTSQ